MTSKHCVLRLLPLVLLLLIAAAFLACGGKNRFTGLDRPGARIAPKIIQLDQALAELDGLLAPEGVDPALFAQLKEALRAALVARGTEKIVCKPPGGPGNAIPDLTLTAAGGGTYDLAWHYYNLGDYDQGGKVAISDITPLAQHFGQTWDTGEENTLAAVIDGSGNGKVGIEDVTPIAVNFGTDCAAYAIGTAPADDWAQHTVVDAVDINLGTGKDAGRMAFTHNFTPVPLNYYWVAPYDADAVEGVASNSQRAPDIPGDPPVADIQADHTSGYAPLTVNFDAAGSHDPDGGAIAIYEWDWEGDGVFDLNGGGSPLAVHEYTDEDTYEATVRVTDDDEETDTASITITVGVAPTYDETEDNDIQSQANALPALPFSSFIGSLGDNSPTYIGYDGDTDDYFTFTASESEAVTFDASFNDSTGGVYLVLFDSDSDTLAFTPPGDSPTRLMYTFAAGDTSPFFLLVREDLGGYTDYSLSGALGLAPTAVLEAYPTWGPPPLDVAFDASGSTDDGVIELFEWDLDGNGSFEENTGTDPYNSATYDTEGTYYPAVRVTDDEGLSHRDSVTINVSLVTYDEVEDNDSADETATPLPAIPFTDFSGSAGDDPPTYIGYDGDTQDFFSFSASLGDTVTFGLEWNVTYMGANMTLYDSDGDYLWGEGSEFSPFYLTYTFGAEDLAPYYLEVFSWAGYADYYLRGIEGAPPTADIVATPNTGPYR